MDTGTTTGSGTFRGGHIRRVRRYGFGCLLGVVGKRGRVLRERAGRGALVSQTPWRVSSKSLLSDLSP
jgi:hypothetical protein